MDVFKFLENTEKYDLVDVNRLNLRHYFIIESNAKAIKGACVLDLASHDGRWAWAFAKAGAKKVVGIEAREELVKLFEGYPNDDVKNNIELFVGDIYEKIEELAKNGEQFDVVGVLGIFYHIMDHYRLFKLIRSLSPRLIIVDSEFIVNKKWPMISISCEDTRKDLNSTAHFSGQTKAPIGIVSLKGIEVMANTLGYTIKWADWESIPVEARKPVYDYYRPGDKRRFTCTLSPINSTEKYLNLTRKIISRLKTDTSE